MNREQRITERVRETAELNRFPLFLVDGLHEDDVEKGTPCTIVDRTMVALYDFDRRNGLAVNGHRPLPFVVAARVHSVMRDEWPRLYTGGIYSVVVVDERREEQRLFFRETLEGGWTSGLEDFDGRDVMAYVPSSPVRDEVPDKRWLSTPQPQRDVLCFIGRRVNGDRIIAREEQRLRSRWDVLDDLLEL